MTFLEALYGSQYYEILQQGKDGNKGRMNANLFLSALVIICLFIFIILIYLCIPGAENSINTFIRKISGGSGKTIGKLLAIPLFALIYWIITKTVGTEQKFKQHVDVFMQFPDETIKKANAKLLIPFFSVLVLFFLLLVVGQQF